MPRYLGPPGDVVGRTSVPLANAPITDPRASRAPHGAVGAFNETLLASDPERARGAGGAGGSAESTHAARASIVQTQPFRAEDGALRPETFSEALRSIPVAIQGTWVGLACIVLLVASAAALRSLSGGGADAVPGHPVVTAPSASTASSAPHPVASASSSVAPPATSTPGSISIGAGTGNTGMAGFGALAIRDRLPGLVRLRKIGPFMDDLERLLAIEPTAIDRADVRKLIGDAATYGLVAAPNGAVSPDGERVFAFLTTRAGAAGPDILFDLVTTRGGTRAATYAEDVLKREDVRAKGTPALRIAYDLRFAATCQDRAALFDRVKAEGDRRVLATLFAMARCGRTPSDCCIGNDPAYRDVVRVINTKK